MGTIQVDADIHMYYRAIQHMQDEAQFILDIIHWMEFSLGVAMFSVYSHRLCLILKVYGFGS